MEKEIKKLNKLLLNKNISKLKMYNTVTKILKIKSLACDDMMECKGDNKIIFYKQIGETYTNPIKIIIEYEIVNRYFYEDIIKVTKIYKED